MIHYILIGILLGAGFIVPGVSGAVLAVIFGVYEKMLHAISNFFKNTKENFLFLLPIAIGMLIGLLIFGKVLNYVFNKYNMQTCFTFIGLILGGVPILIKKANKKGKLSKTALIVAFIVSLLLFTFGNSKFDFSSSLENDFPSFIKLFLTGFVFVSGKIIPGISSSFMLMLIGMYTYILELISNPLSIFNHEFVHVIGLGLGILAGAIVIVKAMDIALKRWRGATYSIIIGFIIGSLPVIYPGFKFNVTGLISVVLLVTGFFTTFLLSKLNKEN